MMSEFYSMLSNIEFKKIHNQTLNEIGITAKKIKNSSLAIVPADKSPNFYKMNIDDYSNLIKKSITSNYKKTKDETIASLNKRSAEICRNLEIDDRVEKYQSSSAYILLKDHKPNFLSKPQCRLINPAKTDLGKISKQIIERITLAVKNVISVNQWRNTQDVINWFNKEKTAKCEFLQFDVISFYPSISKELFDKALSFAKSFNTVADEELEILQHARNSLLFNHDGTAWSKKKGLFDVTMGTFDGAETCDLVGLYLLSKLSQILPTSKIGLYRDDGLLLVDKPNNRQMDRIRKKIHEIFNKEGLKITVENPCKVVNFLDITLNSADGSYRPFRKKNSATEYIHKNSNHPPHIIKRIPEIVENRLNVISSDKMVFDECKDFYKECLKKSGYTQGNIEYHEKPKTAASKKNRRRNILWFNPPWSANVATNIGKRFFRLLERHFPTDH